MLLVKFIFIYLLKNQTIACKRNYYTFSELMLHKLYNFIILIRIE